MRLKAGCEIDFDVAQATTFLLMLRPRSGYGQWVAQEEYTLSPEVPAIELVDVYGNLYQRLVAPAGRFSVRTSGLVETADAIDTAPGAPLTPVQNLPDSVLPFLFQSRYCQSDLLADEATQLTAAAAPGYDQAEAIRSWIQKNVEYRYGASDASTSARDTLQQRSGVCRDFAHLGIALCRSLTIPARMVVGYLHRLEPMDLHAWFEAYVGGRWYTFDATQDAPRGGRIVLGYGPDAAHVALATQFGPAELASMKVWVEH